MKNTLLLFACFISILYANAQDALYRKAVIAFYNCENLYDTINDRQINDEDFLPSSPKGYNTKIYKEKIAHIAKVLSDIGRDIDEDGAAIIGVAEIENDNVLNDVVKHPSLRRRGYQYIHYDSPDPRGVDVALFYNPMLFKLLFSNRYPVKLPSHTKSASFSRDILHVCGILHDDTVHVFVNHWPSRVGGEERSSPAREYAAAVCKEQIDLLIEKNKHTKAFIMGDFNDDPTNKSLEKILGAKGNIAKLSDKDLFNPWMASYKKGNGTLAHQDTWGLFDQIIITPSLLHAKTGLRYESARIFKAPYLVETDGVFKGYPKRTWGGDTYIGGYSDHFPVYLVLKS